MKILRVKRIVTVPEHLLLARHSAVSFPGGKHGYHLRLTDEGTEAERLDICPASKVTKTGVRQLLASPWPYTPTRPEFKTTNRMIK